MTPDRFEGFCEQIGRRFPLLDEGVETLADPPGKALWKIYDVSGRRIRLTLKTTPKFEKEVVTTAKRIGAQAHIERKFSETESVNTLVIEQKDGEEWKPVSPEQFPTTQ